MTVTAVIQARMSSSRLPGKVLRVLGDRSVLAHVVTRTRAANRIDRIVVATTTKAIDDQIEIEARRLGVNITRGPEEDVLRRYAMAFQQHGGETGVRVTADCPFLDPALLDEAVAQFSAIQSADYLSNTIVRRFPRGLDVEVFTVAALQVADREARDPADREHVTPFLYRQPHRFRLLPFTRADPNGTANWRLTLDTEEDWAFLNAMLQALDGQPPSGVAIVESLLRARPELLEINRHVQQKAAWS